MRKLIDTDASKLTILIRLIVGYVIFIDGIYSIVYANSRGRIIFEVSEILPYDFFGYFFATGEIIVGLMILIGLFTRAGAAVSLTTILIFILLIILSIIFEDSVDSILLYDSESLGFWSTMHAVRVYVVIIFGGLYLVIKGGGRWSIDRKLYKHLFSFNWRSNK